MSIGAAVSKTSIESIVTAAREQAHTLPTSCWYCHYEIRHPAFVYLLTDCRLNANPRELEDVIKPMLVSYVGISRCPHLRLRSHRREKGVPVGHKSTNKGKEYWQMELVIGPFFGKGKAFKEQWRKKSRKMFRRVVKGCEMAQRDQHLTIYARDKQWLLDNIQHM